jgi:hypothetical protein
VQVSKGFDIVLLNTNIRERAKDVERELASNPSVKGFGSPLPAESICNVINIYPV